MLVDKSIIDLENVPYGQFEEGDVIGIGIAYHQSKLECFATYNGEFLGKIIEI